MPPEPSCGKTINNYTAIMEHKEAVKMDKRPAPLLKNGKVMKVEKI